jgi:pimeloyl-ACP methyl ester carboxylesterase
LSPKFNTRLEGNRIAYALSGTGSTVVVFESGLGDGMDRWAPVFDSVATFATAFAYDRPGYGNSQEVSEVLTGKDAVERLRSLLTHLEIRPPYVLVGHSLGGQYVELFARLYPAEVSGVVLVDSRHPDFTERCKERLDDSECDVPGLLKLLMPGMMDRELQGVEETRQQIRDAPAFPEIPLAVLSRGRGRESPEWLEVWAETQREYAQLSPFSTHLVSPESGHYVHQDDRAAVVDAIRRLTGTSDSPR